MKKLILALTACAMMAPSVVYSHTDNSTVDARRSYYQLVKASFLPLVAMVKGEAEYNSVIAAAYADNLVALSEMHLDFAFTPGSDNAAHPGKTRALPEIWTDASGFAQRVSAFNNAVADLQSAASQDLGSLRRSFGPVGASCKGCHENYRASSF